MNAEDVYMNIKETEEELGIDGVIITMVDGIKHCCYIHSISVVRGMLNVMSELPDGKGMLVDINPDHIICIRYGDVELINL